MVSDKKKAQELKLSEEQGKAEEMRLKQEQRNAEELRLAEEQIEKIKANYLKNNKEEELKIPDIGDSREWLIKSGFLVTEEMKRVEKMKKEEHQIKL